VTVRRVLLVAVAAVLAFAFYVAAGLPSRGEVRRLATANPGKTSVMRQREQEARKAGREPRVQQSWAPLSRMSRHLIHAVLASEDQKFFGHEGVDWDAVEKAIDEDRKGFRFARGGSTITQQLAKNLYFTTQRSIVRKLREVVVARWLEEELGKRRILELYLNVIEWGDGIYGAQAAAMRYYGKPAGALDEVEAAGLAAMIPNPRRIHPRSSPQRHARAQRRVLWLMRSAGYLKRDVGGLGAEPPPVEEDDDEPASDAAHVETEVAPAETEAAPVEPAAAPHDEPSPTEAPPTAGHPPLEDPTVFASPSVEPEASPPIG
jgi:monofunctional biosynthetic peptidoglycan transglycosylase